MSSPIVTSNGVCVYHPSRPLNSARTFMMTSVTPLKCGGLAAIIVASLVAALLSPATALATPPVGVSAVTLSKQTAGGVDYIVSELTVSPGGSTGWHTNEGELYGVVKAGTVNHFIADCTQDGVHSAGDPITDPAGPDYVHTVRNIGNVPAVLDITYVDSAGAPTTNSAPNPGCPFE